MDSSHGPLNNPVTLSDYSPGPVCALLREALVRTGDYQPQDRTIPLDFFLTAAVRFVESVCLLGQLHQPPLKKMGMGLSSLTLRCRELNGHFGRVETAWLEHSATTGNLSNRLAILGAVREARDLRVPRWDHPRGVWLARKTQRVARACITVCRLCETLSLERNDHEKIQSTASFLALFRRTGLRDLAGPESLLSVLPDMSRDISGRLYREEFLRDD